MNKSKIPEFLIWGVYGIAAIACLVLVAMSFGVSMGFGIVLSAVGAGIGVVLIGALTMGLYRIAQRGSLRDFFANKKFLLVVAESLMFVVLLAGMIFLRLGLRWEVAGHSVYESAQMTNEVFYFAEAHGGYRVYLYLMNIALMLLGNRTFAAILLQLVLLGVAAVSLYFGVRKLAGTASALLVTAFLGFAPYMVTETCNLTPFLVFLLCYGLALNCIGGIGESMAACDKLFEQIVAVLCYIASGVFVGFCCYLDAAGITLLVILTGVICFGDDLRLRIEDERDSGVDENIRPGSLRAFERRISEFLGSPVVVFVGIVLVAVLSFWKMHGSFASLSKQLALYVPGGFRMPISLENGGQYWEGILIAALLVFGTFSFWCSKRMGNRVIWLFAGLLMAAMLCFGMNASEQFNGSAVLYILCVVLAGCGFSDVLTKKTEKVKSGEETTMAIIDMDAPGEPVVDSTVQSGVETAANAESVEPEKQEIKFIENPLPLPKKHVRKVMDYDYEVADDDDFDIP